MAIFLFSPLNLKTTTLNGFPGIRSVPINIWSKQSRVLPLAVNDGG
jgi:hypothetical protein